MSAAPGNSAPDSAPGPEPGPAPGQPPRLDPSRERLILDAVEAALDWPPAQREALLAERYAPDAAALARIRDLLAIATDASRALPTQLPLAAAIGAEPPPPARLGPYVLGELLGRGGMGRVFRAERADGVFAQSVAIKLMRRGFASEALAGQFARERQILADLQHPNIARLLDGGVTADGQSYIVMELLLGQPITQYASEAALSLRDTLALFRPVCAAVAHAHARLVVHADIKPSNVVVTPDARVRLLDFGVARVLAAATAPASGEGGAAPDVAGPAAGHRASPEDSAPLGLTAAYASPGRRAGEPATTIDDVYSLGVLLEELLQRFPDAPPDAAAIAARARADDPAQRYPTAEALREDLQRWLDGRAVRAHAGGWRYAAGKWVARHRLASGIAAGALLLLVGAAIALAVLYLRAEHARGQAEQRFAEVRSLSTFVLFDVYDRLARVPRALPLRRDLADQAQRYLDRLAADPAAPPELRLEVIEGLRRLAQVQAAPGDASLGESAKARANLARAAALAQALPDAPALRDARARLAVRLALLESTIAQSIELDFDAASAALQRARDALDRLLAAHPGDLETLALERDWAVEQASVLQWRGEYRASRQVARDALAKLDAAPNATAAAGAGAGAGAVAATGTGTGTGNGNGATLQRARLLDLLAESLFYDGDARGAEPPYREQLALLEAAARANPSDVSLGRRVARAGWALGTTLIELDRPTEAESLLARAQQRYDELVLLEPDDRDLARSQDITANARAQALAALRRFGEAEPILRRSVAYRAGQLEATPANASLGRDVAIARAALGDALAASGDRLGRREACSLYAQAALDFERIRASGRLPNLDRDFGLRRLREQQARLCAP
jgi:eukaryotic-like serine/threonine-protein kinase